MKCHMPLTWADRLLMLAMVAASCAVCWGLS